MDASVCRIQTRALETRELPHIGAGTTFQSSSALQEQQALLPLRHSRHTLHHIFTGHSSASCAELPF